MLLLVRIIVWFIGAVIFLTSHLASSQNDVQQLYNSLPQLNPHLQLALDNHHIANHLITFPKQNPEHKRSGRINSINLRCPMEATYCGGNDVISFDVVASWQDCGQLCNLEDACAFWTFHKFSNKCKLKYACEDQRSGISSYITGYHTCSGGTSTSDDRLGESITPACPKVAAPTPVVIPTCPLCADPPHVEIPTCPPCAAPTLVVIPTCPPCAAPTPVVIPTCPPCADPTPVAAQVHSDPSWNIPLGSFPSQCFNYMVLKEKDRNISNGGCGRKDGKECYGDNATKMNKQKSPDWVTTGYYRFMAPAGIQMPEYADLDDRCGTDAGGWLQGKHPLQYGVEVNMTACFDGAASGGCNYKTSVTVTRCSSFYVYYLPTSPCSDDCAIRYCATDQGSFPNHCTNYMVLNEKDRNINNGGCGRKGGTECYGDNTSKYLKEKSPDWMAPGYYRFMAPAGVQMPESEDLDDRCGTDAGGWLQGKHPLQYGVEVNMTACFDGGASGRCNYKSSITVTRCSSFYVYYLPNAPCTQTNPPECDIRYCATHLI